MKVAIIGSGMAGLSAAYALHTQCDIAVFEKDSNIGGHALTINAGETPVDVGVNVFSERDYPQVLALFRLLKVPLRKCSMSFAMAWGDSRLVWSSIAPLHQLSLFVRPSTYLMVFDFIRFYSHVHTKAIEPDLTLEEFLRKHRFGTAFAHQLLLPMGCSIYTCSVDTLLRFSANTFITFFKKHGVLDVFRLPTWYNIPGGCREYLERMTESFASSIYLTCPVTRVVRAAYGVTVHSARGAESFDAVIFACHPNDALDLLADPTPEELSVLGALTYSRTEVCTHTDTSVMPRKKECWASWTYVLDGVHSSVHYFVNRLQGRSTNNPVFVTIGPTRPIASEHLIDSRELWHPVFDLTFVSAQKKLPQLQGANRTWYCGAYAGYGFHEDAFISGQAAAQGILTQLHASAK